MPHEKSTTYPIPDFLEGSKCLYQGARFAIHETSVTDDTGKIKSREALVHPGAVVILSLIDDDTVVMIRNERFAVGEILWELPAGTLEPGEPPQKTAEREIIEETGYKASSVEPLCEFYISPGYCTETMYAFVAKGLHHVGQDLDDTEKITVHPLPFKEILKMIKEGTIIDAKTITTILYYQQFGWKQA